MIVLNEVVGDAEFGELVAVIRLHEETARIAKNFGTQFNYAGQSCRDFFHF